MSSVCQYWLQGSCRFGNSCWNRHESPQAGPVQRSGVSVVQAGAGPKKAVTDWHQMSDEEILKGIATEINVWEASKMWPLSVFSFANGAPLLPGLTNYSFEEIRWEAYQAKASNTFEQHVASLSSLLAEARQQKQMLKQPDFQFRTKLLEFIHQAKMSTAGAVFGGSQLVTTQQAPPIFGGQTALQKSTSIFGGASQTATSLFGNQVAQTSATTSSMLGAAPSSANIFGGQTPAPSSGGLFQQAAFNPPNALATQPSQFQFQPSTAAVPAQAQQPTFPSFVPPTIPPTQPQAASLLFPTQTQPAAATAPKLLFGREQPAASSPFTISTAGASSADSSLYSQMQDLTQADVEAFKADHFASIESIPVKPPPRELCF